jgi:hypothetical protein
MEVLDKKRVDVLAKVMQKLPDLMTWEIKSLSVAPEGVMKAIMALTKSDTFSWVQCHNVKCGHHDITVGLHAPPVDATATLWTIPSDAPQVVPVNPLMRPHMLTMDNPLTCPQVSPQAVTVVNPLLRLILSRSRAGTPVYGTENTSANAASEPEIKICTRSAKEPRKTQMGRQGRRRRRGSRRSRRRPPSSYRGKLSSAGDFYHPYASG